MNKTIRLHDLEAFRLADGTIRLSQQSGIDEPSVIDLNHSQLEYLGKVFGIGREKELERRLAVLADKFQDIVCSNYWRSEILERLGDGMELLVRLDALVDLALEFDGGRLKPAEPEETDEVVPPDGAEPKPSRFQPMAPPTKPDGQLGLTL